MCDECRFSRAKQHSVDIDRDYRCQAKPALVGYGTRGRFGVASWDEPPRYSALRNILRLTEGLIMQRPRTAACRCGLWLLGALLFAVAADAAAPRAYGTFPGRDGRLAIDFIDGCIITIKPDGTGRRDLTGCEDASDATGADWSPDGRRLLFLRDAGRPHLMAADGSSQRAVPLDGTPPFAMAKPSFAPDGKRFAYSRGTRASTIWRARVDGREDRRLRRGWRPRWSPTDDLLAYIAPEPDAFSRGGPLRLMNARTGKQIRRLASRVGSLDWSPDGQRLLFTAASCCDGLASNSSDLFVVRADGRGSPRRLARTPGWAESEPVWSPDGRSIAFSRQRWVRYGAMKVEVRTMTLAGRNTALLYTSDWVSDDSAFGVDPPRLSWQARPR